MLKSRKGWKTSTLLYFRWLEFVNVKLVISDEKIWYFWRDSSRFSRFHPSSCCNSKSLHKSSGAESHCNDCSLTCDFPRLEHDILSTIVRPQSLESKSCLAYYWYQLEFFIDTKFSFPQHFVMHSVSHLKSVRNSVHLRLNVFLHG